MKLTLKSLQTRIDNLDTNLNERVDHILLGFDGYKKETDSRFRAIDERFDEVDKRFDEVDRRFSEIDRRFDRLPGEIVEAFSPYFRNIEKMLSNPENRITTLEKTH